MFIAKVTFCLIAISLFSQGLSQPILPHQRTFKWQVHSFNDVRETVQLLKKGTTIFKIDLYYQSQKKCYTKDKRATSDNRGCFILTHDSPDKSVAYDSIYDYFDEIVRNKEYYKDITIAIAFCFKNTPLSFCLGSNQWIDLVDTLYNELEKIIAEHQLNIEIIYDGNKASCIRDRWPSWKYTWIRARDPSEAFKSDDQSKHYDKFAVFNDPVISLSGDAKKKWGKFMNKNRPLQVWEPNHQNDILSVAEIFTSHPHPSGYAYAINIDTSMYQLYTAAVSKEDYNENIINDKSVSMENSAFTHVIKNNGKFIYLFIGGREEPLLNIYHIVNKSLVPIKSFTIPSIANAIYQEIIYLGNNHSLNRDYFLTKGINDNYCIYELENGDSLIKGRCGLFATLIQDSYAISSISFIYLDPVTLTSSLLISYVNADINVKFAMISIKLDLSLLTQLTHLIKNPLTIKQSSPIIELKTKCYKNQCLMLYNTKDNSQINSHIITINTDKTINAIDYKTFGLGKHFDLSVTCLNGTIKYLIVKDNGFCYHNEPANKNAHIKLCDQKEIEMPHILNYIHGDLNESFDRNDNASSVCSKETITGSYDMGDFPKITSFVHCHNNSDPSTCNYEFYELHNGIQSSTKGIYKDCGVSSYKDGIVFDSWQMISYIK